MKRAYKTEIKLTTQQRDTVVRTLGTCRFVYNLYIARNQQIYAEGGKFISGYEFSKWLNNEFISQNPRYSWIKEVSSKAVKQSVMNAEQAFKKFFSGKSKFPKFKKKRDQEVKMFFVKNDAKSVIQCQRHRIKIPTLGWVQLKEYGYLPTKEVISSGTVHQKANRFFVSVLVDIRDIKTQSNTNDGLGIDVGIKDFAVFSNGDIKRNVNKTQRIKKLKKKLKREQRKLSRKFESLKKRGGKAATRQNLNQQITTVQRIHARLANIRDNYVNQSVADVVKIKPQYVTIEDLNVRGMMKNRHLARAIAEQNFSTFRTKLIYKARQNGIEIRIASRFYPSSKTCSECGYIKPDLKLSDRVYNCPKCGLILDRDLNAAINLKNVSKYTVA